MAHTIKVKMFGNFRMEYDDRSLISEKMHKESQFNRLMQVMMHYSGTGISKEKLEEYVIGEREIGVPHTALRVIVYRAKQKLQKLGILGEELIYLENGMYYWTKEIEVIEDAELFQQYYASAQALENLNDEDAVEKRLQLYLEACYTYTGEFLSAYTSEPWVFQEAKKYQQMYCECVNKAAEHLRHRKAWGNLEKLGRYASQVNPLQEWEILVLEAMVECGRLEEAAAFCKEVVDYYLQECGSLPSERVMAVLNKYDRQQDSTVGVIDHIQEQISENEGEEFGGYECSFAVFKGIYQQIVRMTERLENSACLILCTLVDAEGNLLEDEELLEEASKELRNSIATSIRKSDVFTHYGRAKFLLFLANYDGDNCMSVQNRIRQNFMGDKKRVKVEFYVKEAKLE